MRSLYEVENRKTPSFYLTMFALSACTIYQLTFGLGQFVLPKQTNNLRNEISNFFLEKTDTITDKLGELKEANKKLGEEFARYRRNRSLINLVD